VISRGAFSRLAGASALAAAALSATPAFAQTTQTLRIALIPGDISGEAYYAKDLGFFKKAGYEVEFTPITSGAAISAPSHRVPSISASPTSSRSRSHTTTACPSHCSRRRTCTYRRK